MLYSKILDKVSMMIKIVSIVVGMAGLNSRIAVVGHLGRAIFSGWCIYRGNAAEISVAYK